MSALRAAVMLALASGLVPVGRALGQQTSPELVDLLARTVLHQDSVQVVESALPAEWAARLPLPGGMRFLGAVVGRSAATAYLVSAASPAATRALARSAAQAARYVDAPEPPLRAGLEAQRPATGSGPLCRGTLEQLRIGTQPRPSGTLLTMEYVAGPSYECAPPAPSQGRPDPYSVLPKLAAPPLPPGLSRWSCSGGRSSGSSGTQVVSALDLAGVLDFYGRQLEAAGWSRIPGDSAVAGTWQKATGLDQSRVTLVVNGPPAAGCRRIDLELRQ